MNSKERIQVLIELGERLKKPSEYRDAVIHRTSYENQWFTKENQQRSIEAIAHHFLDPEKLGQWLAKYPIKENSNAVKVGIIMAGNIPLVGFHDLLCVFVSGHQAIVKLSDKDPYLLPYLLKELKDIDPRTESYFQLVAKLKGFDAIIATGSNNSFRYFDAYFGKYPHIIRRNRNAVAVLTGEESSQELNALGKDVFQYFGLGCRNVSKLYVPQSYDFEPLLEALHEHRQIIEHNKYKNNFDYNYALLVLNKEKYMANGCVLLMENEAIASRIASLHYEFYDNLDVLKTGLEHQKEAIQCIVAKNDLLPNAIPFGKAQQPELWDYADGVDTMGFLLGLSK